MLSWKSSLLAALLVVGPPAAAQDIPSPYDGAVSEFGQRQLQDRLARRRLEQARRPGAASASLDSRRRASCATLPRFARQYGREDPSVRKLTDLCRRGGYIR